MYVYYNAHVIYVCNVYIHVTIISVMYNLYYISDSTYYIIIHVM